MEYICNIILSILLHQLLTISEQQLIGSFNQSSLLNQQQQLLNNYCFEKESQQQVEPPLPVCKSLLPPITPYIEFPVPSDCANVTIGTRCSLGCIRGYELIGPCSRLCCGTGTWSGYDAICINRNIRCRDLTSQFPPGSLQSCPGQGQAPMKQLSNNDDDEVIKFDPKSISQRSFWRRGRQVAPTKAIPLDPMSCLPFAGSVCSFCCPPGLTPDGPLVIYCQDNGSWNSSYPTCGQGMPGVTTTTLPTTLPTPFPPTMLPPGVTPGPPTTACFDLNPPAYGTVRGSCVNAALGQQCIFMCDEGYNLAGANTLTCNANGWTSPPPVCVPIYCPNITDTSIMNGRTAGVCTPGMGGKECTILCDAGYRPSNIEQPPPSLGPDGTPVFVPGPVIPIQNSVSLLCLSNMMYDVPAIPTCVPITCPSLPPTIPNGFIQAGSKCTPGQALSLCSYQCSPGYQITGSSSTLLCQLNGGWTANVPRCTRIQCPSIQANVNRTVSGQCDPGFAFETCTVKCNIGLQPTTDIVLRCTVNGGYERIDDGGTGNELYDMFGIPICVPLLCPKIEKPENGILVEGEFSFQAADGAAAAAVVVSKYQKPRGGSERYRQDHDHLQQDRHHNYHGRNRERYQHQASNYRKEEQDGEEQSAEQQGLPNAGLSSCTNSLAGGYCVIQCNPGYFIKPNEPITVLTCNATGFWNINGPLECLPIQCPPKVAPIHSTATIGCGSAFFNDMCTITCDEGYTPETQVLTCTATGMWDNEIMPCMKKTCKDPNGTLPIPNGIMTGPGCWTPQREGIVGECCVYSCDIGYALTGTSLINCVNVPGSDDGIFVPNVFTPNGNAPKCVQVLCPPLPMIENGMFEASTSCSNRVTSICRFTCSDGFTLAYFNRPFGVNSLDIQCSSSATWTAPSLPPVFRMLDVSRLRCVEIPKPKCRPILIPDNGAGTPECTDFNLDTMCVLSCNFGFELVGTPRYECKDVNGVPTRMPEQNGPPMCRPVLCPGLSAPSNGFVMGTCNPGKPGMSCQFGCNNGYIISPPGTPSILECLGDGSYSAEVPYCSRSTCPAIVAPPGNYLVGVCTPGQGGESCGIICPPGFRTNGPTNVICGLNGMWMGEIPTCVAVDGSGVTLPTVTEGPGTGIPGEPGTSIPGQPGSGTPGTGIPGLPGGRPTTPRPGTGSGCRPRRRCCPRLFIPRTVIVIGCKNLPRYGLAEAGTTCTLRCNYNIQYASSSKQASSAGSPISVISDDDVISRTNRRHKQPTQTNDGKQEFNFFGIKSRPIILTVQCMRSQQWSGGDPMSMPCTGQSSSPQVSSAGNVDQIVQVVGPPIVYEDEGYGYNHQQQQPPSGHRPTKDKKKNDRIRVPERRPGHDHHHHHQVPSRPQPPPPPIRYLRPPLNQRPSQGNRYQRPRPTSDDRPWVNIKTNQSINFNVYSWILIN